MAKDFQGSAQSTADRLAFAAMKLFLEKGYGSTSVQDILREAKANAGSLYHAFPTKQDVLIAVLNMYREGLYPMLLNPAWEGVGDPVERIFALLARYRQALETTECTYGCPIGSLALELHEPDPPVRELLAANFDGWTNAVKACLNQAKDRFPKGTDTEALSQFILTVMEGGVMQARTHRNLKAYDASVAALRDYLKLLEGARR
ncbi:MAG TPA: TetR/AcrR family transcriptional regulator [Rhizomicrobium sp.]|nr:TetR/AcrR family transcriptional regulator [Rhizomicrobium sp.]